MRALRRTNKSSWTAEETGVYTTGASANCGDHGVGHAKRCSSGAGQSGVAAKSLGVTSLPRKTLPGLGERRQATIMALRALLLLHRERGAVRTFAAR